MAGPQVITAAALALVTTGLITSLILAVRSTLPELASTLPFTWALFAVNLNVLGTMQQTTVTMGSAILRGVTACP